MDAPLERHDDVRKAAVYSQINEIATLINASDECVIYREVICFSFSSCQKMVASKELLNGGLSSWHCFCGMFHNAEPAYHRDDNSGMVAIVSDMRRVVWH